MYYLGQIKLINKSSTSVQKNLLARRILEYLRDTHQQICETLQSEARFMNLITILLFLLFKKSLVA